jgi:hypothetical protein
MWKYQQSTGQLTHNGQLAGVGYSGYGDDKNQPNDESIKDLGPIPCGLYSIGVPECAPPEPAGPHGPFVLPLTPDQGNAMFGRAGFLIHGDSIEAPGFASRGCMIFGRLVREAIAASGDFALAVIA